MGTIEMTHNLPFKVGQTAESKSFETGYRGAWFRCKIKEIGQKNGEVRHRLEYFDYPGEKIGWTQLYQKSRTGKLSKKRNLMVRPSFPPIYHNSQIPDICTISEVIAIVDGTWKVGDLVDWCHEDCYWSGRITHILDEDNVQVQLPEPPKGEGSSYEAPCKDLRPSLDWSPEHGWTVPINEESETCRRCARLIQPANQGRNNDASISEASSESASASSHGQAGLLPPPELSSHSPAMGIRKQPSGERTETTVKLSSHFPRDTVKQPLGDKNKVNLPSSTKKNKENTETPHFPERKLLKRPSRDKNEENLETPELSLHPPERKMLNKHSSDMVNKEKIRTPHINMDMDTINGGIEKSSFSDSVSTKRDKDEPDATRKAVAYRDRYNSNVSLKKMRTSEAELNSTCFDSIESSILDLEELVTKVKWLKGAIKYGRGFSNAMTPRWKYLEKRMKSASDM